MRDVACAEGPLPLPLTPRLAPLHALRAPPSKMSHFVSFPTSVLDLTSSTCSVELGDPAFAARALLMARWEGTPLVFRGPSFDAQFVDICKTLQPHAEAELKQGCVTQVLATPLFVRQRLFDPKKKGKKAHMRDFFDWSKFSAACSGEVEDADIDLFSLVSRTLETDKALSLLGFSSSDPCPFGVQFLTLRLDLLGREVTIDVTTRSENPLFVERAVLAMDDKHVILNTYDHTTLTCNSVRHWLKPFLPPADIKVMFGFEPLPEQAMWMQQNGHKIYNNIHVALVFASCSRVMLKLKTDVEAGNVDAERA